MPGIERPRRRTTCSGGTRTNLLFTMSTEQAEGTKPSANFVSLRMTSYAKASEGKPPDPCHRFPWMACQPWPVRAKDGGAGRDRTDDPLLAKQVLSQLSYGP